MKITQHKTSELFPYINNAREHSESQVTQIASSIREFGFTNPLLIDDNGGIIAGHGRLMAAKKLEMDEVPCIVLSGLSEAKKKALILADNKLALNATWDEELLKLELESLAEMDVDIGLTGFDSNELDNLLREFEEENKNKEVDCEMFDETCELKFNLTIDQFKDVNNKLSEIHENKEIALLIQMGLHV